jgi:uncharacterized membrane protein YgdD (TMEM256/DUF423 family)
MNQATALRIAALGLLAVALGAFGAHGLKAVLALTNIHWLGAITPPAFSLLPLLFTLYLPQT